MNDNIRTSIRIAWTLTIGWWLALLWVIAGLLCMLTIVGWPLAYKLFDSTWAVLTADFV